MCIKTMWYCIKVVFANTTDKAIGFHIFFHTIQLISQLTKSINYQTWNSQQPTYTQIEKLDYCGTCLLTATDISRTLEKKAEEEEWRTTVKAQDTIRQMVLKSSAEVESIC